MSLRGSEGGDVIQSAEPAVCKRRDDRKGSAHSPQPFGGGDQNDDEGIDWRWEHLRRPMRQMRPTGERGTLRAARNALEEGNAPYRSFTVS